MPLSNRIAEVSLLNCILCDAFVDFDAVKTKVPAEAFESDDTRSIYRATLAVYDRDKTPPNMSALAAQLEAMAKLESIDADLIKTLFSADPSPNVETLIYHVNEAAQLRGVFNHAAVFARAAKNGSGGKGQSLIDELSAGIKAVSEGVIASPAIPAWQVIENQVSRGDALAMSGGKSGADLFTDTMRREIGKIEFGQLVIVAAATSHGKSAFSSQWAFHLAREHKIPSAILTLEMPGEMLMSRTLASETGVQSLRINEGTMNANDRQSVAEYAKNARHWPIYFGSRISRKLPDVIRWLSDTHREHGCKFMVVDFLQLITLDRRVSTKNEELEIISNELQSFAIDKNVVLVVPSQVSRGPAQRDDKVPTIDDLRGSGGIGQSADVVIILHRKPLPSGWSGEVMEYDVRLAKNRNGATTTFVAGFMPRYVKFVDVDPDGF